MLSCGGCQDCLLKRRLRGALPSGMNAPDPPSCSCSSRGFGNTQPPRCAACPRKGEPQYHTISFYSHKWLVQYTACFQQHNGNVAGLESVHISFLWLRRRLHSHVWSRRSLRYRCPALQGSGVPCI